MFFLAFAPDGWGNPFKKHANLRLYFLFKYSIVDETLFPKGIIIDCLKVFNSSKKFFSIKLIIKQ